VRSLPAGGRRLLDRIELHVGVLATRRTMRRMPGRAHVQRCRREPSRASGEGRKQRRRSPLPHRRFRSAGRTEPQTRSWS
jgi:hypothetical protein